MNKTLLAIPFVLLFAGCSTVKEIQETVQEVKKTVQEVKKTVQEMKAVYTESKTTADTNKDGKTTGQEWLAYLLGGGGLVSLLTSIAALVGNKATKQLVAQVSTEQDQLWEKTHKPVV